jgi:cellulose biosynthesis protein BcsQ
VKTAVVDCDTQANLSQWLAEGRGDYELADYFEGACSASEALTPIRENLDIIVTATRNSDLPDWEKVKLNEKVFVFRKLVRDLKELGYEVVLFDLPPTFTTLHSRVYLAVDEVIASSAPTIFSEEGLTKLASDLESVNEDFGVDVRYRKLILVKVDKRVKAHKQRLNDILQLESDGYQIFFVPTSTAFSNSQEYRLPVYEMPDSKLARTSIERIIDVIEGEAYGKVEEDRKTPTTTL